MSWALHVLDLDETADERAIKRAYAKRLRSSRPDEDAAAFQQLHEAYQAALAWVRMEPAVESACLFEEEEQEEPHAVAHWHSTGTEWMPPQPRACSPPLPPPGTPVLLRTAPVVELEGVVDVPSQAQQILRQAHLSSSESFGPWLDATPILWSLRYKPLVGQALLDELARGGEGVCAANLDLLARCFGWDDVHDGVDPDRLAAIQAWAHRRWAVQAVNATQLSALLEREGSLQLGSITVDRCLRYLSQPWDHRRSLWQAQLPEHINEVNALLDAIESGGREPLPVTWDPQQVLFWRSLADVSRPNRWRWQVNALRGTLLAILCVLVMGGAACIALIEGDLTEAGIVAAGGVLTGISLTSLGMLWVPARWALRQLTRDLFPQHMGLLLALPAPLMAIASLVLIHGQGQRLEGTVLLFPALALATARWVRRDDGRAFKPRNLVAAAIGMFFAEAGIALILLLWITEIVRHRRHHGSVDSAASPPGHGA